MTENDFWDRVKHGTEKLGIPGATFRTWKSRGRVSRDQAISLYEVLAGTEHEIPLEKLK